ncbi:MAG TPA: hypothetical protein VGS58_14930 [Candidatus Sulfopaludibacter sp.]|nr:hypothetical protein [Candidatus Sulfopaludibacter sp.]
MTHTIGILFLVCLPLAGADNESVPVPLGVPAGAPLRLYLTSRIPKKVGAKVQGKLLEPVFAFDREVIPAGTTVAGSVSRIQSVPKWQRVSAILAGDLTPLHVADVEFTTLVLPGGRQLAIHTVETEGLNSIYVEPSKKKKAAKPPKSGAGANAQNQDPKGGALGTAKSTLCDQIKGQIDARTQSIEDMVRGPDKKERIVDYAMSRLPYHPQYIRRGTRFDAVLSGPLDFGTVPVPRAELGSVGTQPPADSAVRARLVTPLDSATAKRGEPVEAVVVSPLFSPDHKLLLPEGTRVTGAVVLVQKARMFHRGGKLRFNFQTVEAPETAAIATQAVIDGAEASGKAPVKVDSEGGVQASESKTRLLAPLLSLMVANKAADNDAGRHAANGAANGNVSGRTLGGGLGFGMLGSAIAQSSRYVGMAFGYYGLAWSVYSNVVARGGEVEFARNAMVDIKFGARPGSQTGAKPQERARQTRSEESGKAANKQ